MIKSANIHYLFFGTMTFLFALDSMKIPTNNNHIIASFDIKPDYRNFYGISWRGNAHENLAYARQMKYDYVFYQNGMENDTLSNGLHFYLEEPEYMIYDYSVDLNKMYTTTQKSFIQNNYCLKNNTDPFPKNIATGIFDSPSTFCPALDFQQQKVIDNTVKLIINLAKSIESKNPQFHFGGVAWDYNVPAGFFQSAYNTSQTTLAYWTGGDYGAIYPGCTHEYATYTDGNMQFLKQLFSTCRQTWPDVRFMTEPYHIYDDWIGHIKNRLDASQVVMDLVCQEGPGTEFLDDSRISATGLITKDRLVCTTPNQFSEVDNRTIAARAAINGSTFTWFGRFGGTGDMPNYQSITAVPARLKLIRIITTWENKNNTALAQRTWDGTTYKSPTAFAGPKAIGVLQPGTSKFFIVLMALDAEIPIPADKIIVSISRTNNLFLESGNGSADLIIKDGKAKLNGSIGINKAYILNFKK